MWPEIIIEKIELIYWYLYQIDLLIGDKKERMFISQSELLIKLWEANAFNEGILFRKADLIEIEKQLQEKWRETWYWYVNDDWSIMNEKQLTDRRLFIQNELNEMAFPTKKPPL